MRKTLLYALSTTEIFDWAKSFDTISPKISLLRMERRYSGNYCMSQICRRLFHRTCFPVQFYSRIFRIFERWLLRSLWCLFSFLHFKMNFLSPINRKWWGTCSIINLKFGNKQIVFYESCCEITEPQTPRNLLFIIQLMQLQIHKIEKYSRNPMLIKHLNIAAAVDSPV